MEVEDFIADYYLTSKWQDMYRHGLQPVNGPKFWTFSDGDIIEAPPYKRPPGRPKGKARIKGVMESPKKRKKHPETKVSRKRREMHCGLCGEKGHNSRKCLHESEENRVKRKRIKEGLASEEAQACEETQASEYVQETQAQQEQGPSTRAQTSQPGSDD
ncbi:hypothetical protein F2Q69_00020909 [Brassica cretica]|uniref:CCHC-type domain-containing protein n=1 Tax=Brassica cretica TaxID=69181 RepID=A0A8S9QDI1_BRACR|nr:hypothetical protein F2Q69_00020909 [Brassica cretica]